jgi:hypothetical protein
MVGIGRWQVFFTRKKNEQAEVTAFGNFRDAEIGTQPNVNHTCVSG